jgi:hypothetical protein
VSDCKERSNLLQKQRLLRRLWTLAMTVLPLTFYALLKFSSYASRLIFFTVNDYVQPPTLALAPATVHKGGVYMHVDQARGHGLASQVNDLSAYV